MYVAHVWVWFGYGIRSVGVAQIVTMPR